jgi:very-short-patch-repair endonuclease
MREKQRTHHALAGLAERQHGVVSIRQLRRLGYTEAAVGRALAAGRLHRLWRGVYAVGHTDLSPEGRCLAAVLACAPGALLSHGSAAWLWGLYRHRPGAIDVTAPTRRHRKPPLRLHYARLHEDERALREGIPVTSVARLLLDLAATLTDPRLESLLERCEELELFDLGEIDATLARAGGHHGAGRLRRCLAIYRSDPAFTRSRLERRFLALVLESGLPRPATNFNVAGLELDAYWEAERFAVELDVYETHGTRAAFERDRRREEELLLAGIESIRITGPRLKNEPQQVMERLTRHLARRHSDVG